MMCLLAIFTTMANPITESQAKVIASGFMASKNKPDATMRMVQKGPRLSTSEKAAYYVFNSSESGYVIVSGDDRCPSVLGYSDNGTFDSSQVPEAMQELLDSYAEQIKALDQGAKAVSLSAARPAIRPLLTCAWAQNTPYNTLLPYISGNHAVAGCVATAMAQVMYYYKWPARPTTTIPAYTTSSLNINMPALPIVDFQWNMMQDTYLTNDTASTAALAAAKLTLYCAQSVEANFMANGTSATTSRIPMMLANYFGYKSTAHSISRDNYSSEEWAEALYSELAAGRPVVYDGKKKTGAHAFICDGYDGNGMYHINWGWNGLSNGYFLLNVLNPDEQSIGGASGSYGYIYEQAAIVGIEPGTASGNGLEITTSNVLLNSYTTSRTGSSYNFTANVSGRFYNYTSQVYGLSCGWGLYQGETLKSVLYYANNSNLKPGSYLPLNSCALNFGKNITSGTYRIVPIYSEQNAGNWRPCIGADKNYIEVTINGNTCSYNAYGTAAERNYTVNQVTFEGTKHNGRPMDINVNLTNNGNSCNDLLHMFVNGTFSATGFVSLEKGQTGDVPYKFLPTSAGTYTITFSFNEDGSDPIASRSLTITEMPAANLSGQITVLNVTNASTRIITDNMFRVKVAVTNNGATTYNEEISASLYKQTHGNYSTPVQGKSQAIVIAPGETKTLEFEFDNVTDGWKYIVRTYYYSSGTQVTLKNTSTYTIIFPEEPEFIPGDVNNDGCLSIADVTTLIDYLLGSNIAINMQAADLNNDSSISIADVTALIDMLLSSN